MIIKVVPLLPSCWGTTSLITFVFSSSLTVLNSWTHKNHFVGDWEWFPRYSWHNPTQPIARKLQPERQLWLLDTCPPPHVYFILLIGHILTQFPQLSDWLHFYDWIMVIFRDLMDFPNKFLNLVNLKWMSMKFMIDKLLDIWLALVSLCKIFYLHT